MDIVSSVMGMDITGYIYQFLEVPIMEPLISRCTSIVLPDRRYRYWTDWLIRRGMIDRIVSIRVPNYDSKYDRLFMLYDTGYLAHRNCYAELSYMIDNMKNLRVINGILSGCESIYDILPTLYARGIESTVTSHISPSKTSCNPSRRSIVIVTNKRGIIDLRLRNYRNDLVTTCIYIEEGSVPPRYLRELDNPIFSGMDLSKFKDVRCTI